MESNYSVLSGNNGKAIRFAFLLLLLPSFLAACKGGWGDSVTLSGLATSPEVAEPTGKLNDTGITRCGDYAFGTPDTPRKPPTSNNDVSPLLTLDADNDPVPPANRVDANGFITGQDCHTGRDVTANDDTDGHAGFRFIKLDANSVPLGNQAVDYATTPWSCVKDKVTGLIWEVKTSDTGLRLYTWGSGSGDATTDAYLKQVNAAGLCGYKSGWRLPTPVELGGIAKLQGASPTIDTAFFPNTLPAAYWTSSPAAQPEPGGTLPSAWVVSFASGEETAPTQRTPHNVRLVLGGNAVTPVTPVPPVPEASVFSLSASPLTVVEGSARTIKTITLTVTRTGNTATTASVDLNTVNDTATVADADYLAVSSRLDFAVGETSKTIPVTVNGDTKGEANETFSVNLSNPGSGAVLGSAISATLIIINDDAAYSLTPLAQSIIEGSNDYPDSLFKPAMVTINRSVGGEVATVDLTIDFGDTDMTDDFAYDSDGGGGIGLSVAEGDIGYVTLPAKIGFAAGDTSKTIAVWINQDYEDETNETFSVRLINTSSGTITPGAATATITITDDDMYGAVDGTVISVGTPPID